MPMLARTHTYTRTVSRHSVHVNITHGLHVKCQGMQGGGEQPGHNALQLSTSICLLRVHRKEGLGSTPEASLGEASTSNRISSFCPSCSMGPGMYMVIWGPTEGQYHPRLNPFKKSTPFDQAGMARKESGKMPCSDLRLASALKVPLQCRQVNLVQAVPSLYTNSKMRIDINGNIHIHIHIRIHIHIHIHIHTKQM